MDKVVSISSIILGFLLIGLYLFRCYHAQKSSNLSVMISLMLQASGFVCGFFLITSVFSEKIKQLVTGIDIYIVIAGIAVIYVSAQLFYRDVIKSTKSKDSDI